MSELLAGAERGGTLTIARGGIAAARLMAAKTRRAAASKQRQRVMSVIRELAIYRDNVSPDMPSWEAIKQGFN